MASWRLHVEIPEWKTSSNPSGSRREVTITLSGKAINLVRSTGKELNLNRFRADTVHIPLSGGGCGDPGLSCALPRLFRAAMMLTLVRHGVGQAVCPSNVGLTTLTKRLNIGCVLRSR